MKQGKVVLHYCIRSLTVQRTTIAVSGAIVSFIIEAMLCVLSFIYESLTECNRSPQNLTPVLN